MASSLRVRRREPELIHPASPTPHEYKMLSDIDIHLAMRLHPWTLFVYRSDAEKTIDPAKLVRDGLARALVFFYPLAGRLREHSDRKLVVECNGEGALFVEGDADFSIKEIGVEPHGSAPYYRELICDIPRSGGIIGCPLLRVQVTRLKCGGFTVGVWANHGLMDASGIGQLLKAIAEMARGAASPSVLPVWQRELLSTSDPRRVIPKHPDPNREEYEERPRRKADNIKELGRMISRTFFFGSPELATLRRSLPEGLRNCSTFDVLGSFLWRSRVFAFDFDPKDEVMFIFAVDIRRKVNPTIPMGYYGNALFVAHAVATAGALRENPLEYAVALVKKAKSSVSNELVRSFINATAEEEKPPPIPKSSYSLSDLTKTGVATVDFGWGKPVFTIPSIVSPPEDLIGAINFFTRATDGNGEERVMVAMDLPEQAMERISSLIDDLKVIKSSRL